MIRFVTRAFSHALLCCLCLLVGIFAFAVGAVVGGYGLGVLAIGLSVLNLLPEQASPWFAGAGAMLGGGWALLRAAIECVEFARESPDPAVRRCAQGLHELGQAMSGKPPA